MEILSQILKEKRELAKTIATEAFPRGVLDKNFALHADLVNVIQGVRRCGKSTLQALIAKTHSLDWQRCYFINFEDPRLAEMLNFTLLSQIRELAEKESGQCCYFFFDEIQDVELWPKWLHTEVEKKKHFFSVTGSNSSLLAGQYGTSLTGRNKKTELFPFSFSEFRTIHSDASLASYFVTGGFPRVLSLDDEQRLDLLRQYFIEILERDVKRRVAARSTALLSKIAKAVFESTGSETSLKKLAAQFQTSVETCKSYVEAYADAYLILPCQFFTESERQRVVRPSKYYPIDLGMHRAITTRTKLDLGKKLETVVFQELRRRHRDVFYWRDKHEVDFVIETSQGIQPIQVTWEKPEQRHTLALQEFKNVYPNALPGIFITQHNLNEIP